MADYAQYGFDGVVPKPYTVQRVQMALQGSRPAAAVRRLLPPQREDVTDFSYGVKSLPWPEGILREHATLFV